MIPKEKTSAIIVLNTRPASMDSSLAVHRHIVMCLSNSFVCEYVESISELTEVLADLKNNGIDILHIISTKQIDKTYTESFSLINMKKNYKHILESEILPHFKSASAKNKIINSHVYAHVKRPDKMLSATEIFRINNAQNPFDRINLIGRC